jgi:enoyl-CoA hydratase/carnithine racemase
MPESGIIEITFEKANFVATITLNRPQKLNAVTTEMSVELARLVTECNSDSEVRVVVLTGAGPKAFCAGSDVRELDAYQTAWAFRNRFEYCDAIRALRKPLICAINGYCLGGGLELALGGDIRLAADSAQFGAPEIKLGWIGGGGMAFGLTHTLGPSNAALMLFTGDTISAIQALAWGLVSELVPAERLLPRAREIAGTIAQRPPIAAETAKINLRAAYAMFREEAIRYERDMQTICFATEDAAEGRNAFKEKRQGIFRGK